MPIFIQDFDCIVFTFSYSPEHLVQENVIVVTFNYRLSALGFLYLPEAGIYGNAALKDQVSVLIPQRKTHLNHSHSLFSVWYSNGSMIISSSLVAIQTMLHYLDKVLAVSQHTFIHCRRIRSLFNALWDELLLSLNGLFVFRKYFHKVICQSGVALHEWAIERNPEEKTRKLAKLLGCQSDDSHEILGDYCHQNDWEDKKLNIRIFSIAFLKSYVDLPRMIGQHFQTMSEDDWRRGFPLPFRPAIEIENVIKFEFFISFWNFSEKYKKTLSIPDRCSYHEMANRNDRRSATFDR